MAGRTHNRPFAIDARMLGREGTGVATYAAALSDTLTRAGLSPILVSDSSCGQPMARAGLAARSARWADALVDRPRLLRARGGALTGRDIFRLAQVHFDRHGTMLRLIAPGPSGIIHWTYPLPIRIEGWINIYTVHDAIPILHPRLSQIDPVRHLRLLRAVAASAEHLLTVSESARADIVAAIGCDPALISACPPGLDVRAPADAVLPAGLRRDGFLLFAGSVEPRKNLLRLAEAHRRSGSSYPLVVAGPDGWRSEEIAPRLAADPTIVRLPYVDRPTLMALMANARALAFPTITEGFGLPIVEAMQLGAAVLTARGGATEEVAGGAALLADPMSIDDLAIQLGRLSDDVTVARLRADGLARSSAFSAAAFATRLGAVHTRLLAKTSPNG